MNIINIFALIPQQLMFAHFVNSIIVLIAGFLDSTFLLGYFKNLFVLAIWIFFAVACVLLLRHLGRLKKDKLDFERVKLNSNEVIKTQERIPEIIKSKLLNKVDSDSLLATRVDSLYKMSRVGPDIDAAALADNLFAREIARLSFPRYVANILVLLGLCGAIFGLSNLVQQMGPDLRNVQELSRRISDNQTDTSSGQNKSLDAVQSSIITLIDGMASSLESTQGAFAASLTGVLFSILLLFLNWFVSNRQVLFLTEIESFTNNILIPLFKSSPLAFDLSNAVNSFNSSAEHTATLADKLNHLINEATVGLGAVFAIVHKFNEGTKVIETSQQSITAAHEKMLESTEQLTNLTKQIEQHQAGSKQDISSVVTAVGSSSENIQQVIAEWRGKHEEILQQMETFARKFVQESEDSRTALKKLLVQDISQFRAQVLESFEHQQKFGQEQVTKMLTEQKQYVDNLQTAVLNGQGHKELIGELNKIFKDERQDFSNQIKSMMELQQKNFTDKLKDIAKPYEKNRDNPGKSNVSKNEFEALYRINKQVLAEHKEANLNAERTIRFFEQLVKLLFIIVSGLGSGLFFVVATIVGRSIWTESSFLMVAAFLFISVIIFFVLYLSLKNTD